MKRLIKYCPVYLDPNIPLLIWLVSYVIVEQEKQEVMDLSHLHNQETS
jgi:hypothetical protein